MRNPLENNSTNNRRVNDISPRDHRMIRIHCDWLSRTGATDVTVGHRRANLQRLAAALPGDLLDATPEQLDQWQSDLRRRPSRCGKTTLATSTIGTYTAHTRRFYAWALHTGHIEVDPAARLPRPRSLPGSAHPIPESDLLVALAAAAEPLRTWLLLAAFMGLRAAEIAGLRRDSITEVEGRLILDGIGKGRKPFRLTVPRHVEPSIRAHMGGADRLWGRPDGAPARPTDVSRLVARFFDRQGMPYTLHWARHSFGTATYAETKDLLLTQEVMRHASPETTRIYVRTSSEAGTRAMDDLAARLLKRGNPRKPAGGSAASAA